MVHSEDGSPYIGFTSNKTRDYAPLRFAAHLHFDPPEAYPPEKAWMTAAQRQPLQENTLTPAQEYVVRYLREEGESGRKELMENATICTPKQVRKAVHELVDLGLIERVNEGGKGVPALYNLSEEGKDYVENK